MPRPGDAEDTKHRRRARVLFRVLLLGLLPLFHRSYRKCLLSLILLSHLLNHRDHFLIFRKARWSRYMDPRERPLFNLIVWLMSQIMMLDVQDSRMRTSGGDELWMHKRLDWVLSQHFLMRPFYHCRRLRFLLLSYLCTVLQKNLLWFHRLRVRQLLNKLL